MGKKRHKPEEIVAKLRQVNVLTAQGQSIAEAVRTIAVTETTYFRWRSEYGGMKSDQVWRKSAQNNAGCAPLRPALLPAHHP